MPTLTADFVVDFPQLPLVPQRHGRPEYHPNYYGAFVRDPDGNNVEAVCHSPE